MQALRYIASVLDSGFPLVAFLQLTRVFGQAIARIADAETRLFHIYVHEPLMREGVPGLQMAEEMEHLARDLLPLASPIMDYVHQRYLQQFVEQDVVGHMETELDATVDLGRVPVSVAFADLAGYTRYTEEEGEEQALSYVERFIDAVADTLPDDARIVKSIGDEVMVIGYETGDLVDWAVGFQRLWDERPAARIGIHSGLAIYRDGDYFGARRQPRLARGRAGARRRGPGHERRQAGQAAPGPPRVRGHRRGEAEGLRRAPRALPRGPGGMMPAPDGERPLEVARESGLVAAGEPLLVMLSGGPDSVCLLDVAIALGARVSALHVNHGLRPDAAADEALCRSLCERHGVPLTVEPMELGAREEAGNLQAEAREARYALAERQASGDYAAAHTATDQAETVLYRLAVSPGRRALLAMRPRRGRLVRPLLEATRAEARARCEARGLEFVDDPSNADPRFARARVRHEVLPVLSELNSEAERGIAETSRLLRDEQEVLERAVDEALERTGRQAVQLAALAEQPRGLARLVVRRLAEEAAGRPHALTRQAVDRVLAMGARGGTSTLDLGGGLRAVAEYGVLRFATAPDAPPPDPVRLPVPGSVRFGGWEVDARVGEPGEALLSSQALGPVVTVRAWREGDRMSPAGLGGSKSLQDLFTDRKVPRTLRRSLPVVEADGEIAWVAGVAVGERFRADAAGAGAAVGLSARRASP